MLKIDGKKHRGFEEEYVAMALGVIANLRLPRRAGDGRLEPEGGWAAHRRQGKLSAAFKIMYLFYQKTEAYGVREAMGLPALDALPDEDDLRAFMRSFLLADPEAIHKGHVHLKENKDQGKGDCKEDIFLKYYQEHAYKRMCSRRDDEGVKYNVRIIRSLGIRVCPYCGCEYIGGRGDSTLGAELDHFVSKVDYPFFALCLYNLIPSCSSCNNHKNACDSVLLISPLEADAAFDANLGIRLHSRPYVRISEGKYHESRLEVRVLTSRLLEETYDRYKENADCFMLPEIYDAFETEAVAYVEKMIRYPKTQMKELGQILAKDLHGIAGWPGRTMYMHQLEKDLFLNQCAQEDEQTRKINSKMYTDLYRTYRKPRKEKPD